ncbi:MAG: FAD-binding protein [Tunicatimonas sp.]|uniref:FAD-binding protein n=1 Tax=Tunicatimonas sp. TaxID=1940096 RepID=UPI003C7147B0
MKRKAFLNASSALVAGSFLSPPHHAAQSEGIVRKNWAGNYTYQAKNLHEPRGVEEIPALVKKLKLQKPLGSRHCFNNIADSPLNQISTQYLNKVVEINEEAKTITVEAGVRYGDFAPELHQRGYALHNMASLPHISVAGACVTGTHGSGVNHGNLSTAVAALEFVTPQGEVVTLHREKDSNTFNGVVVNLGAIGLITKLTLDMQDTFEVRQDLFQELPLVSLQNHFDEIVSSGYSVSLFTDWQNNKVSQIWMKRKVEKGTNDLESDFYGARAATRNLHPITRLSAEHCTEQLGVSGPWYERLPHFKMGFTPSSGEELQSEYFVPRQNAVDAILAVEKMGDQIFPQLLISEIRTIAADNFWMSPCYQQDSVAIHFTWKQNWGEVQKLLPKIETELSPYGVRPHWGKLFTIGSNVLQSRYDKLPDFLKLMKTYDPQGKLRNTYLNNTVYTT